MKKEMLLPVLRHVLQGFGMALATKGYIDESVIPQIVGIGTSAFSLGWYFWEKRSK